MKYGQRCLLVLVLLSMAACHTGSNVIVYEGKQVAAPAEPEPEPVFVDETQLQKQRVLADILFDARMAFADNRLMLPAGRNAYELYQQVLRLDPENTVALDGIQEIVLRYLTMADTAIQQAAFEDAEQYLARAARLNPDRPELGDVKARLAAARKNRINVHELNPAALRSRSLAIMNELAEIARQLQSSGGTFLIRARTDEEGRWIYKTMSESAGGKRLHGNIQIAPTPGIVISVPAGESRPATRPPRD